jgi:hypothetical protein
VHRSVTNRECNRFERTSLADGTHYRPLYILYDVAQIRYSEIQIRVLNSYYFFDVT